MQFVIGRRYLCRDGSIAEYVGKASPADGKAACYSEVFRVNGDKNWWTREGLFYANAGEHRLDIIKEQAMQLEAGKYYKTRDGRKAFVAAVGSPFSGVDDDEQALGWVESAASSRGWQVTGKYTPGGGTAPFDLVSEWIDPPQEIVVDGITYVRKAGT